MGLDMYLYRERKRTEDEKISEEVISRDMPVHTEEELNRRIDQHLTEKYAVSEENRVEQIAYWRKANAIHSWFVKNVQGGVDECKAHDVPTEKLKELLVLCNKVLSESVLKEGEVVSFYRHTKDGREAVTREGVVIANPEIAQEYLPTQGGFFFGDTSYNEYYINDVKHTKKEVEKALDLAKEDGHVRFMYRSSW